MSAHYKTEHGLIMCTECGDQFAGVRRADEHFAEMHAPQQQHQEEEEDDIGLELPKDDDDVADADTTTEKATSREEEEDSAAEEVGFSWRWPPPDD